MEQQHQKSAPEVPVPVPVPTPPKPKPKPNSIEEEIKEAIQNFPKLNIISQTKSFFTATYQRTIYTRIKFTITFPENYPIQPLILDIHTNSGSSNASNEIKVPPGLKKKLEKECTCSSSSSSGQHYQQVGLVLTKLTQFVDCNKLFPCWKELKQCLALIRKHDDNADANANDDDDANANDNQKKTTKPTSTIMTMNEKTGKIKLKLHNINNNNNNNSNNNNNNNTRQQQQQKTTTKDHNKR
jgi:hypothetical protein